MTLTDDDLQVLIDLERHATPGPWDFDSTEVRLTARSQDPAEQTFLGDEAVLTVLSTNHGRNIAIADLALLHTVRNLLPEILAELVECRKQKAK